MVHKGFSVQDRALGRFAAWTAFIVNGAYAVASGLGFLSLKSPSDPISDPYLSIMALLIVLMAPFLVVTMVAVLAYAPPELKSYARAALAFMILLAGTTSSVNFALLIVSRQVVAKSSLWLSLFLPYKWPAAAYAMDLFAWEWFFALSMLFAAPVFRKGGLEKAVRLLMIVSAVLSLLGLIWLLISPIQATAIGILGWGVAGPIVFLLLAKVFGRAQPETARFPAA
jgi:hypothetical protein